MTISVTETAASRVQEYLAKREHGVGVRLGVRTSGCSGLAYVLEFVDQVQPEDLIFKDRGVTIVVEPKSLLYLDGTELDFVQDGVNQGFAFNNPNVKDSCGCGESFTV